MISIKAVIGLLVIHFMADFVLQTNWMAMNKSSKNWPLFVHVAIYAMCISWAGGFYFAVLNGALHFGVDYVSSRMNKKFFALGKTREYFVVLGLDQLVHMVCLILTYQYLRF